MEVTVSRGKRIAQRFELEAPLPDVGLGECWAARDLQRPDSPVQVEFLCAASTGGFATREAFDGLLARMRPVSNPGILGVVGGGGDTDGRLYLVTERLEGRSLANWLSGHRQAGTRPGITVVQRLFDKVCNAVQFAHAVAPQPVVHRALTPRSILLRRVSPGQHHVKVGDFGLAPFSPGASAGSIGAWWEYQAPEQHGGRWNEPPTADVFALAVILVEMLSLSALPRAEGRETWWQYIKEGRAQAMDRLVVLRGDVPRGVWEVIAAAMKQSPKERTPSVQRFQRALRDAWQADGEWQTSAGNESEPPVPTTLGDASSLVRSAPGGSAHAAAVIDGWQAPERRQESTKPPSAARPEPHPATPEPTPPRPAAPVFTPTVNPAPTLQSMAAVAPPGALAPRESAARIDPSRSDAFGRVSPDPQARQDSTMALDIGSLESRGFGSPGAPRGNTAGLFGEAFEGDSNLDPALGTQVMAQGVGAATQPPSPSSDGEDRGSDTSNTTRAIDTAGAFAQLERQAQRRLPPEAMATLKTPPRARRFIPAAPRPEQASNSDQRATHQMMMVRSATVPPHGSVSPTGALNDASGDLFARPSFPGDPFAGDAFGAAAPSSPPVEPTQAIPIEAMPAGAFPPYGGRQAHGSKVMPPMGPTMIDTLPLPPMNTPFAMGAPPRDSEMLPSRAPPRTIAGQPAWIVLTVGVLLVVIVGATAFILAGGR